MPSEGGNVVGSSAPKLACTQYQPGTSEITPVTHLAAYQYASDRLFRMTARHSTLLKSPPRSLDGLEAPKNILPTIKACICNSGPDAVRLSEAT